METLRSELRRLQELVDGWSATGEIPSIERDLALAKLRALYDAVRFAAPTHDEASAAVPAAEAVSAVAEEAPIEIVEVVAEPETAAAEPTAVAEPAVATEPAEVDVPAIAPAVEEVPAPEAVPVPETVPAPEAVPVSETVPVPETAAEPTPAVEAAPAAEPAPVPEAAPAPEAAPEPTPAPSVASTLFGPEEAVVRHRHKQRVIMSLYDPDPVLPSRRMPPPVMQPAPAPEDFMADIPADDEAAQAAPAAPTVSEQPAAEAEPRSAAAPDPQPAMPVVPEPDDEPLAAPAPAIEASSPLAAEEPPVAVLGEAVNHDVQTLADTFAPQRDRADALACEAVDDLRRAIGINDKFLLIRDLFGGDARACDAAIETLNGFDNLDDCMIHIAENYAWNANSDGAKFLMELLERKFA